MEKTKKHTTFLVLIAIFGKLGKLGKVIAASKPILVLLGMVISALAYAHLQGPWFAIGFVVLLFIHELGHVIALKKLGYPASAPIFIPFVGAVVFAPRMNNREDEAYVGIGGPVLGTIGAIIVMIVWILLDNKDTTVAHVLLSVSFAGALLNLFNLIPVSPLDGGRIAQAIGPVFKYIGLLMLAGLTVLVDDPTVLFIWVIVFSEMKELSPKWRNILAATLSIVMVTLLSFGVGGSHISIRVSYILLGSFLGLLYFSTVIFKVYEDDTEQEVVRPNLSVRRKWIWFTYYMSLILVIVTLMVYQAPHLTKVVK